MLTGLIEGFRLSTQQERLWALMNSSAAFRARAVVQLDGALNRAILKEATRRVIEKHEILRTFFHQAPGMKAPVQVISEAGSPVWREFDFSVFSSGDQIAEIEKLFDEEGQAPFCVDANSVLRATLIAFSAARHALMLSLPSMHSDRQSLNILIREIGRLYAELIEGAAISEEPDQYADLSEWQYEILKSESSQAGKQRWKNRSEVSPARLSLRADCDVASSQFNPSLITKTIDPETTARIEALCAERKVAPAAFLLACWQTLLARMTGDSQSAIGYCCDGRKYEELQSAPGLFARHTPLAYHFEADYSFSDALMRAQQSINEAYEWQECFLQEDDAIRFFPTCFEYSDCESDFTSAGVSFSITKQSACIEPFELKLACAPQDDVFALEFHFDPRAIRAEDAEMISRCFETIASDAAASPESPVADLNILAERDFSRLVFDFNSTQSSYPADKPAHQLFEEQTARTPDNTAIKYGDSALTYRELNSKANRLAHHLRSIGVGPDSRIAICMERSVEMVIAIWGALKSGGAYVPIDPAYPTERLAFMMKDAAVAVTLTLDHFASAARDHCSQTLCLDTDWERIERNSDQNPSIETSPENLAYMIYTSGSTGQPKGAMITHSGLVNYLAWAVNYYDVSEGNGSPVHSPLAFDLTVTSIFSPLLAGRAVELVREDEGVDGLISAMREDARFGLVKLTPAHLDLISQRLSAEQLASSARALIVGGEALLGETLQAWKDHGPDTRIVNEYGPTETVVGCCIFDIRASEIKPGPIPIGWPIANTQLFVLDERLRPAPAGVSGELYIGGDGLARGYHNRPDLTAEKFIPNPFSQQPGARMYRTGDLSRHSMEGYLEYFGRVDDQVKIRGYRVELGEIEAALKQHTDVSEAAVIVREDEPGDKRLAAYIVAQSKQPANANDLRDYLRKRLPDYMIPSAFVMMDALPLTRNGKVDRRALPEPDVARSEFQSQYAAPRTLAEETLAEIWAEVLKMNRVGVDDNFFALGGDSIRSIMVRSRAQQRGLAISHQQIFQHQTIRELAQVVSFGDEAPARQSINAFDLVSVEDRRKMAEGIEDAYPVSMLQAGMIFHTEYATDAPIFHDQHSFQMRARFDAETLRAALEQLIDRHATLRTSFDLSSFAEPLQLVHKTIEVPFEVFDITHISDEEQAQTISKWLESEKRQPFNWAEAPLLRFYAHRRSEDSFQFTLTFHHAIMDGWSVAVILTELFSQYVQMLDGPSAAIDPPSVSFRDFIALERAALESEQAKRFWNEKLDERVTMRLPRFDDANDADASRSGVRVVDVPVSIEVSEGLKRLARGKSVPVKSVLLAAHLRVMSFLSGQADVTTGVVSNGRPEEKDGDRVAGLFLNTLPFRLEMKGGAWTELVEATFDAEREMLPYRWYPLAELQRENGGQPLFETAFNFLHYHVYQGFEDKQGFEGIQVMGWEGFEQTNFTLLANFSLALGTGNVELNISFDSAELSDEQMEAIGAYYSNALAQMAARPESRYETAALLSDEDRRRLIFDYNNTRADYSLDSSLHSLVEQQSLRSPDAIAVSFEQDSLSYRDLNHRANQLAHFLISAGTRPDSLVGICLDRSLEMVVGLLGILKAGAAYVPIDPSYPADRISFMISDSRVPILLTQQHLLDQLISHPVRTVALDSQWDEIARFDASNPDVSLDAQNLAYMIYTSGTTGRPKGAMVHHRGIVNRLLWMQHQYNLTSADRVLQKTAMSFDVSVWEYFWPLITGARLVVARPGGHQDRDYLLEVIKGQQITVMHFVPSMLRVMVEESGLEQCDSLRAVISSGEALSPEIVEQFHSRSQAELENLYGPTEASVDVTRWRCERGARKVKLGQAITNTRIYILDGNKEAVAEGVAGELWIGGEAVGRGYHERAEMTAERYQPDPYGEAGSRMYRTGDIARRDRAGEVEYLGREDNQIKIRGMRIEVAEVESALKRVSGVKEAVALAREEEGKGMRLIGYVEMEEGIEKSEEEIRESVRRELAEWMTPGRIVKLERMPQTANGKIDRKALPTPDSVKSNSQINFVAPRTPVEEMLAAIWSNLLKEDVIGVNDNFFEIGGHSVLATRVISRVRESFRVNLQLRTLFESPTIAGLAEQIQLAMNSGEATAAPLTRVSRDQELPLSFAEQRLWFLDQLEPGKAVSNIPAAVRLFGKLNIDSLRESIEKVISRHENLRTTFKSIKGRPARIISDAVSLNINIIELDERNEATRETRLAQLINEEAARPFDLAAGPLLRVSLVRLATEDHVLFLTMHHIISDGWSVGILINEIATAYEALCADKQTALADLPIQYADFACWQRERLQGNELEAALAYWKQQLSEGNEPLDLPLDRPRPQAQTHRGATLSFTIAPEILDQLKSLARKESATLYITLLAGFQTLLHRYTGQPRISVGSPISGREQAETEAIIGCFVNTLVMRADLSGNPTFREALGRARETALGAYAHQELPFDMLVEHLQPERSAQISPLFQVWFVLHNTPMSAIELPELSLVPLESDTGTAAFDLTLSMAETNEGLAGWLNYNVDLFDQETVAEMIARFERILRQVAVDADVKLFDISLDDSREREIAASETESDVHEFAEAEFAF